MDIRRITGLHVIDRDADPGRVLFTAAGRDGGTFEVLGYMRTDPTDLEISAMFGIHDESRPDGPLRAMALFADLGLSAEATCRLLEARGIHGLNGGFAKTLADQFGEAAFVLMETAPDEIGRLPGAPDGIADRIAAVTPVGTFFDTVATLRRLGVPVEFHHSVRRTLGRERTCCLEINPYDLCEVSGIGFEMIDRIGLSSGIARSDDRRIQGMIAKLLDPDALGGRVGLPLDPILDQIVAENFALKRTQVSNAFVRGRNAGRFRATRDAKGDLIAYTSRAFDQERRIARKLVDADKAPNWPFFDVAARVHRFEEEADVSLADNQRDGIEMICANRLSVITGGPGVGKKTMLRAALDTLTNEGVHVRQMAPTGAAAKRMLAATGRDASTIDSALLNSAGDPRGPHNPFPEDLIAVDEASMLCNAKMDAILGSGPIDVVDAARSA